MSAPLKLTIFGVGLLLVFGASYFLGGFLISEDFVTAWLQQGNNL